MQGRLNYNEYSKRVHEIVNQVNFPVFLMQRLTNNKRGFKLSYRNCISDDPVFGGRVNYQGQLHVDTDHVATRNDNNKNKYCSFCKMQRIRTKSGWNTKSRFKCAKCNVTLCIGERGNRRNCFHLYHEMLKNKIIA